MFRHQEVTVKRLGRLLKLLSEPNRLRILLSLGLDCRHVSYLIEATGLTQTNVSFHLRVLREAGLVEAERRGSLIFYCLHDAELLKVLGQLNGWLEQRSVAEGMSTRSRAPGSKPASVSPKRASARRARPAASAVR